jgi:hypothetical protein
MDDHQFSYIPPIKLKGKNEKNGKKKKKKKKPLLMHASKNMLLMELVRWY